MIKSGLFPLCVRAMRQRTSRVAALIAVAALFLTSQASAQTFLKKDLYANSNGGVDVVAHDFNKDGKLDFLVASEKQQTLATFTNMGGGIFTDDTWFIPFPQDVKQLALGDIDQNGTQDLFAASEETQSVWYVYGETSGAFVRSGAFVVNGQARSVASGDFNKDGRADFVVGYADSNKFEVFKSITTSTRFESLASTTVEAAGSIQQLAAADFDKDGNTDVAVITCCTEGATEPGTLIVYRYSNGSFSESYRTTAPAARFLNVADHNTDGYADLVYSYLSDDKTAYGFGVALNTKDGKFSHSSTSTVSSGAPISGEAVSADVNSDGVNEIAVTAGESPASKDHKVQIFRKTSSGYALHQTLVVGLLREPRALLTADFNADKKADLVTANYNMNIATSFINGYCIPPATAGVSLCSPENGATVSSPVQVVASARSSAAIRYLQVWVDGVKVHHQNGATLDASIPMNTGARRVVVTAVDQNGTTYKATHNITVGEGSTPSNQPPAADMVIRLAGSSEPLTITADLSRSTDADGHIASYTIDFGDGTIKAGPTATHTYTAPGGTYTVKGTVTDDGGASASDTESVTVQSSGTPTSCLAAANSVNICSPSAGATVPTTVRVLANAHSSGGAIKYMQLWIDGVKVHHQNGDLLDHTVTLAVGRRRIAVTAVNTAGTKLQSTSYVTVQ